MVHFPASDLDPLRFTVQNGNGSTSQNGTETQTSSSQSVAEGELSSSSPDIRPECPEGRVTGANTSVPSGLVNGGEYPLIGEEQSPNGGAGSETVERAKDSSSQDQLDQTLYRREGTIYNLVAITVSSL